MLKAKPVAKPKPAGPIVDRAAAQEHHLTVLKRIDAEIEEVLANATHVALYSMGVVNQQWTRKNVEGSLFLVKRKSQPRFQMMILNKVATGDYVETIDGELGFEVQQDSRFLMYTHGNDEILGVWFYDAEDLERVSGLLNKVIAQLPKRSETDSAIQEQETAFFRVDNREAVTNSPSAPQAVNLSVESAQDLQRLMAQSSSPAPQEGASNLAMKLMKAQQDHQKAKQQPTVQPRSPLFTAMPGSPSVSEMQVQTRSPNQPPAPPADPPQPPPSKAPSLITPDVLFKLAAGAVPSGAPSAAADVTANGGDHLKNLFAKAVKPAPAKPSEPPPAAQLQVANSAPLTEAASLKPSSPPAQALARERVRQAFTNLLANDAFVDMVAQEFRAAGMMQ